MTDYSYTKNFHKEQWAWEFLRRNPEYQHDYAIFFHRWTNLEKDYGKKSKQNSQDWRNDLRSLANEWGSEMTLLEEFPNGDGSNSSQETVQIDKWIGDKWGFKSFPLNPDIHSPKTPEELHWLEPEMKLDDIRFDAQDDAPIAQINFDLRYSLQDQLDAAHKDLITLTSQLQRLGKMKLVASDHYDEWLEQITLLDDKALFEQSSEREQLAAQEMMQTRYLKILLMRG